MKFSLFPAVLAFHVDSIFGMIDSFSSAMSFFVFFMDLHEIWHTLISHIEKDFVLGSIRYMYSKKVCAHFVNKYYPNFQLSLN